MKPYAGPCPLYNGMWVAWVKLKGFLSEEAFESALDKAGYHNVYENVYERQAIYDKVFMSYIMRGYKVSVRGAGCFYPYIQETPFKVDNFNTIRISPRSLFAENLRRYYARRFTSLRRILCGMRRRKRRRANYLGRSL